MTRIMIVDDDVVLAEELSEAFTRAGYTVSVVHTTEQALPAIVRDPPDLIILDVMFPETPVGGFELARQIRRRRELRSLPIIHLTAINQEFPMEFSAADIDGNWMPVQDFFEKPVDAARLLRRAAELLAARPHSDAKQP